jgi:hypothetical protein
MLEMDLGFGHPQIMFLSGFEQQYTASSWAIPRTIPRNASTYRTIHRRKRHTQSQTQIIRNYF